MLLLMSGEYTDRKGSLGNDDEKKPAAASLSNEAVARSTLAVQQPQRMAQEVASLNPTQSIPISLTFDNAGIEKGLKPSSRYLQGASIINQNQMMRATMQGGCSNSLETRRGDNTEGFHGVASRDVAKDFLAGKITDVNQLRAISISDYVIENESTLTFPEKLMLMLAFVDLETCIPNPERTGSSVESSIAWTLDGRAFIVRDKESFVRELLPLFFPKSSKFASFARKLYRWGFRQLSASTLSNISEGADTKGAKELVFGHQCFQRDNKTLMGNMRSVTAIGTRRALASLVVKQKKQMLAQQHNQQIAAMIGTSPTGAEEHKPGNPSGAMDTLRIGGNQQPLLPVSVAPLDQHVPSTLQLGTQHELPGHTTALRQTQPLQHGVAVGQLLGTPHSSFPQAPQVPATFANSWQPVLFTNPLQLSLQQQYQQHVMAASAAQSMATKAHVIEPPTQQGTFMLSPLSQRQTLPQDFVQSMGQKDDEEASLRRPSQNGMENSVKPTAKDHESAQIDPTHSIMQHQRNSQTAPHNHAPSPAAADGQETNVQAAIALLRRFHES